MKKPRVLSAAEKEALVRRTEAGEPVSVLSKETGVLRKSLYEWKAAYRAMGITVTGITVTGPYLPICGSPQSDQPARKLQRLGLR